MALFPTFLSLASLDGANGFRIDGATAVDQSGLVVAGAGDINGDGIDDLIVGAERADPDGRTYAGESYVIFGSDKGFDPSLSLADLDGANGFRLDGIDAFDFSGRSVAGAGDVNGDGIDDLIIGATGADPNGTSGAGESYVVFGSDQGFDASLSLASLNGANGFRLDGIDGFDGSGRVAGAGDVNGDGIDDLIVGAPLADRNTFTTFTNAGESYVVFGSDRGFGASLSLASLNGANGFRIDGDNAYDFSGGAVAGAGDFNGDGIDDLIVGAQGADPSGRASAGVSYVVFGSDRGFGPNLSLANLNRTNGLRLIGADAVDQSGLSVAGVGDVNGDGFDDVIVGAPGADPNGNDEAGESYVVFGFDRIIGPTTLSLANLNGTNGFRLLGTTGFRQNGIIMGDESGFSVSGAGDVNGDGIDDLIVGAFGGDPNGVSGAGESYVVFGSDEGFAASLALADLDGANGFRLDGIDAGDRSGTAVAGAGDVNGDGVDDLIVGAPRGSPNGLIWAGESYVVFGRRPNEAPTITAPTAVTIDENTAAVAVVGATDPDDDPLVFSIEGGEDAGAFIVDPTSGALAFASPPDFENPDDRDTDNVFEVIVGVSDGVNPTVEQAIAVTVADVDEFVGAIAGTGPLAGTDDPEIFAPSGFAVITAGGGRDRFDFTGLLDNGQADVITVYDAEAGEDIIGLTEDDIAGRAFGFPANPASPAMLYVQAGNEGDFFTFAGVDSLDDLVLLDEPDALA